MIVLLFWVLEKCSVLHIVKILPCLRENRYLVKVDMQARVKLPETPPPPPIISNTFNRFKIELDHEIGQQAGGWCCWEWTIPAALWNTIPCSYSKVPGPFELKPTIMEALPERGWYTGWFFWPKARFVGLVGQMTLAKHWGTERPTISHMQGQEAAGVRQTQPNNNNNTAQLHTYSTLHMYTLIEIWGPFLSTISRIKLNVMKHEQMQCYSVVSQRPRTE